MAEKKEAHHGKQPNQKMKPFIVMQYLQRNTDENHTCSSTDIIDYLNNECGISADRRSIYRDIAEINKAMYMIEQGVDIETAADDLEEYEDEKLIVYDPNRKGFYFRRREYEPNDVRLLVESVYASKFLTKKQADALVDVACSLVSDPQAEKIKHSATYLVDRVKTSNASVMVNIDVINEAMSKSIEGRKPHTCIYHKNDHSVISVLRKIRAIKLTDKPFEVFIRNILFCVSICFELSDLFHGVFLQHIV